MIDKEAAPPVVEERIEDIIDKPEPKPQGEEDEPGDTAQG